MIKHKHNKKRLTLLAAIDNTGIVVHVIIDRSVNKDVYSK